MQVSADETARTVSSAQKHFMSTVCVKDGVLIQRCCSQMVTQVQERSEVLCTCIAGGAANAHGSPSQRIRQPPMSFETTESAKRKENRKMGHWASQNGSCGSRFFDMHEQGRDHRTQNEEGSCLCKSMTHDLSISWRNSPSLGLYNL